MSFAYDVAVLALAPKSYWHLDEASAAVSFADSVGAQTLSLAGAATPPLYDVSVGKVGVRPGIDLSQGYGSAGESDVRKATAIDQVVSNKFSVCGWFAYTAAPVAFNQPLVCASYSGGHVTPFYIFYLAYNGSGNWRIAINTNGTTLVSLDTGVAVPAQNGVFHHIALTYDGTRTRLYQDGAFQLDSTGTFTGNLANTMGSFSINSIPALASVSNKGPAKAASWAYWNDYALLPGEVRVLFQAGASVDPTLGQVGPIVRGRFA